MLLPSAGRGGLAHLGVVHQRAAAHRLGKRRLIRGHRLPGDGSLRIEVRDDGSETVPTVRDFEEFSENGRGLEIVRMLAHRWGQNGDEYGRCVFFELHWNPPRTTTTASGH